MTRAYCKHTHTARISGNCSLLAYLETAHAHLGGGGDSRGFGGGGWGFGGGGGRGGDAGGAGGAGGGDAHRSGSCTVL